MAVRAAQATRLACQVTAPVSCITTGQKNSGPLSAPNRLLASHKAGPVNNGCIDFQAEADRGEDQWKDVRSEVKKALMDSLFFFFFLHSHPSIQVLAHT